MTTTETFAEASRRNQEALVHIWVDGVRTFWGLSTDGKDTKDTKDVKAPIVPSAEEVVDNAFNYFEKVLATQREYVKAWLAAGKVMVSSTAWLAQSTTKHATSKKG